MTELEQMKESIEATLGNITKMGEYAMRYTALKRSIEKYRDDLGLILTEMENTPPADKADAEVRDALIQSTKTTLATIGHWAEM